MCHGKKPPTLAQLVSKKIGQIDREMWTLALERRDLAEALDGLNRGKLPARSNKGFEKYDLEFKAEVMKHVRFPTALKSHSKKTA